MSMEAELSFTLTFGSCVMAEHSRLESVAADMQKSDFIGSISHELRSPLHGVLASAEFLSETSSDPFQSSLINTVSSCGRTLLDTINHILDYSKINKFERSWVNARNSRARKSTLAMNNRAASNTTQSAEAPPLMNIYSTTDLAIAAEEVVEGVYAGQIYQDISSVDIMHKSADSSIEPLDHQRIPRGAVSRLNSPTAVKNVEVILDIAPGDYVFTTQIGAVRRVIMNVFGNALKYTNKGLIVVKLSLSDLEGIEEMQCANEKLLTISIKDTGKGIASKYLKDSLYKPFSQEDVLATGVGLGLSIVKSIVTMLNGSIDINSQVGVGTQVVLRIPLLRLPGVGTSTSTPSTVTSSARSGGPNPVITMLSEHPNRCISLYGFSFETQPEDVERHRVLEHYVIQWFHYRIAEVDSTEYDIIIVDEQNVQRLCSEIEVRRPIVILCGSSPPKLSEHARKQELVIEIVSNPFGPYKLAKALQACLSRLSERAKSSSTAMPGVNASISESSSASTETPQLERLTLDIDDGPMELSQMGSTTARDTANANMAINSPSTFSGVGSSAETESSGSAFPPMPHDVTASDRFRIALLSRPRLDKRVTEPVFSRFASPSHSDLQSMAQSPVAHSTPKPGSEITSPTPSSLADIREERKASSSETLGMLKSQEKSRSPRLLLVEDNKINLRLLQTYMRKRKYRLVDSAENGQLAVNAAKAKSETYDIIFMDISMPIMNGFEATRAIREIEDDRRREKEKNGSKERMRPALIIALTGLASARDQSEAFASGVDLFMTKPVSFKEVGQLLDNWEANEKSQQEMERTAEDLGLRSDASKIALEDGR